MKYFLLFCYFGLLFSVEITGTYHVKGMMCGVSCPKAIKKSLDGVHGIKSCTVSFDSKTTTVVYESEQITNEKIIDTIEKSTYFKLNNKNHDKSWSFFNWLFGNG